MRYGGELRQHCVADLDAVCLRELGQNEAARTRHAHFSVQLHHGDQRFDAFLEHIATGHRGRVYHQERLAKTWPVAFVGEERVGFETECRTGQRAAQKLDDHCQHGALEAARGQHHAGQPRGGIGGGLSVFV